MAKKRKKRRTQKKRGRIWKKVLAVVLFLIVALSALGCAYYFTGGFGGFGPTFSIDVGEDRFYKSGEGLYIKSGDEIRVNTLFGEEVEISILSGPDDFALELDAEPYKWQHLDGDYTKGFEIEQTEEGFTISYDSIQSVIEAVQGRTVTITEGAQGDVFTLVVKLRASEIRLDFGVELPVTGVKISPDNVTF